MNQPPHETSGFYAFQNSFARPSTANRQTHDTGSVSPSANMFGRQTLPRQQQQQQQQQQQMPPPNAPGHPGHASPSMYSTMDERGAAYDQFSPTTAPYGNYTMNNHMAWNYNGGGGSGGSLNAATMGFQDGLRSRNTARRAPLPSYWATPEHPSPSNLGPLANSHLSNPYQVQQSTNYGNNQYASPHGMDSLGIPNTAYLGGDLRHPSQDLRGEDLIPTAIVIKNIPFNVRKETLELMMDDMGLPKPYAFNYHFDKQVFRGLAFANFQSADDTRMVISQLNGYEVQGRKLRVEYKKMLPEQERDRIEREKRQKRGQLQEQHQNMPLQQHPSLQSLTNGHEVAQQSHSPIPAELNFNDPQVLKYYTELAVFKSSAQEIVVFPGDTTPEQRRLIHSLAHNMGLEHASHGAGDQRQVRVFKKSATSAASSEQAGAYQQQSQLDGVYDANRRVLNRAATIDFGESRLAASNGYATIGRQGQPTIELPEHGFNSTGVRDMRGVKSHADLRSNLRFDARTLTPSPSPLQTGYGQSHQNLSSVFEAPGAVYSTHNGLGDAFNSTSALTTPSTPGGNLTNTGFGASETSLVSGISNLGLGPSHEPVRQSNPGAIGSQRPSMNQLRNVPERTSRGPEWEPAGFNNRDRTNGHRQRGSGSSNLATQDSYSELLTGSQSDKRAGPMSNTSAHFSH